jgi:hypothetical protein
VCLNPLLVATPFCPSPPSSIIKRVPDQPLDPSRYPTTADMRRIVVGHGLWIITLFLTSTMTLSGAAAVMLFHFLFERLLDFVIPDYLSMLKQAVTACSALAFSTVFVVYLWDMVVMLWKFRDPASLKEVAAAGQSQEGTNDASLKTSA